MPYIKQSQREAIEPKVKTLINSIHTVGEFNYTITLLIHKYLNRTIFYESELHYADFNELIGVLECAKLELYRIVISPYEEEKKEENGSISNLDKEK